MCEGAGGELVCGVVTLHILESNYSAGNVLHSCMAFDFSYLEVQLCVMRVKVGCVDGLLQWFPMVEVIGVCFPWYVVSDVFSPAIDDIC